MSSRPGCLQGCLIGTVLFGLGILLFAVPFGAFMTFSDASGNVSEVNATKSVAEMAANAWGMFAIVTFTYALPTLVWAVVRLIFHPAGFAPTRRTITAIAGVILVGTGAVFARGMSVGVFGEGPLPRRAVVAHTSQLVSAWTIFISLTCLVVLGFRWWRNQDGQKPAESSVADLPIANYRSLTAAEIVRRVRNLPAEELLRLRDFEVNTKHRVTVLRAIDTAFSALGAGSGTPAGLDRPAGALDTGPSAKSAGPAASFSLSFSLDDEADDEPAHPWADEADPYVAWRCFRCGSTNHRDSIVCSGCGIPEAVGDVEHYYAEDLDNYDPNARYL